MLSTSKKVDPLLAEAIINKSPLVKMCLLAGEGRPRPILMIQRNSENTGEMTERDIILVPEHGRRNLLDLVVQE